MTTKKLELLKKIRSKKKYRCEKCGDNITDYANFRDVWEDTISDMADSEKFTKRELAEIAKQLQVHLKKLPALEEFYE